MSAILDSSHMLSKSFAFGAGGVLQLLYAHVEGLPCGICFYNPGERSITLPDNFLNSPLELADQPLQLSGLGCGKSFGLGSGVHLLTQCRSFGSEALLFLSERSLFRLQGGAVGGKCFRGSGMGMLERQRPPLPCQSGNRLWRVWNCQVGSLTLQPITEPPPPGLQPARDCVR